MLLGGALRGRSPRTREGRIGPTAQKGSGQQLVVSCQGTDEAISFELIEDRRRLRCFLRYKKVHLHFGMHLFSPFFLTPHTMSDSMAGPVANVLDEARTFRTHDVSISNVQ